jgi:hypothetical protein
MKLQNLNLGTRRRYVSGQLNSLADFSSVHFEQEAGCGIQTVMMFLRIEETFCKARI